MNRIYTLWWQGFDNAPDMVKICHQSLKRSLDPTSQELIALDQGNLEKFVQLPGHIMKKYEEGIITKTHLSDIIRSMLLRETGGLWVDATMFFTKKIPEEIFERDFFTMHNPAANPKDITSKWECFFIGGKSDFPLFSLLTDFWLEYWKNENELITYLLIDHIFYIAYKENKRVQKAIDTCPEFRYRIDYFQRMLNKKYSDKDYKKFIEEEPFIKMTYKSQLREVTMNHELTYYGYLKRMYSP